MKEITLDTKIIRKEGLQFSKIDNEIVLLSPNGNEYLGMNETASKIYNEVELSIEISKLVQILKEEFNDIQGDMESDVIELIKEMLEMDIIKIST